MHKRVPDTHFKRVPKRVPRVPKECLTPISHFYSWDSLFIL